MNNVSQGVPQFSLFNANYPLRTLPGVTAKKWLSFLRVRVFSRIHPDVGSGFPKEASALATYYHRWIPAFARMTGLSRNAI